ncbi:hypothetical protein [Actinomadura sp. B10D3]|uniref:hypothetical protein n=1 Tax=Actinomadura sp. B10D3 TaxID=3153557 RepID=UPI00325D2BA7
MLGAGLAHLARVAGENLVLDGGRHQDRPQDGNPKDAALPPAQVGAFGGVSVKPAR